MLTRGLRVLVIAGLLAVPATTTSIGAENGSVTEDYFLIRLGTSLGEARSDGTFPLWTGMPAVDELIATEGVHRIEFALRVSLRAPANPEGLRRHGLDRTYRFHVPEGADVAAIAGRFDTASGVVFAEPDRGGVGGLIPDDPLFATDQWNLDQPSDADVNAPEAWDITTGNGVVLAILDTGIDSDHEDLAGQTVLAGWDIRNDDPDPEDDHGHGTAVTSVAAAATDNGVGMAGVCWGCSILPVKTHSATSSYSGADLADGIVWAVDNGADVINISSQGTAGKVQQDALAYAADAGVPVVSIAGNLGTDNVNYPGRYTETITLGSTNSSDQKASHSNYGWSVDLTAPGENILKADMGGGHSTGTGTSFAAPHAAGLAGLMLSIDPSLGREEVRHLMQAGADDQVGDPGQDTAGYDVYHGWGRLNLHRTLQGVESGMTLRVEGKASTRVYLETANPLAASYDFVRGDLAALSEGPEAVDLSTVVCLEDDSADADTAGGHEDGATPGPGEAFFYLARFNGAPGAGSYGGSTTGRDRFPLDPHHQPRWLATGGQGNARLGTAVGSGDVNGDGIDDVIAGLARYTGALAEEGAVQVYLGTVSGPGSAVSWQAEGGQASSRFGQYVEGAGDVNGDGYDDVLVGAPLHDNGENSEGRAYLFHGGPSGPSVSPDWTAESNQAGARFGARTRAAGDVNGDGFDDVLIGAQYMDASSGSPGNQPDQGAAFLYLGSASGLATTPDWEFFSGQANARGGRGLGGSGDFNGDGYDDILVGAPWYDNGETNEGRVFVFYGSASGPATTPDDVLEVNVAYSWFGWSIDDAGDVNGDGFDDVVIGAPSSDSQTRDDEGRAYVFLGSASGIGNTPVWSSPLTGQPEGDFGVAVAGLGDLDGDGYDEIAVGAELHDAGGRSDRGGVWIFRGSAAGPEATAAWVEHPLPSGGHFGGDITAGNFDGDLDPEMLVGSGWYTGAFTLEGRALEFDDPLADTSGSLGDCAR